MHQLGPTELDVVGRHLGQAALAHRELVDAELGVLLGGRLGRDRLAGLEVDQVQPTVGAALDPVDRAAHAGTAGVGGQLELEAGLRVQHSTRVVGQPAQQRVQHAVEPLPLVAGLVAGREGQAGPDGVDVGADGGHVGGDLVVGDRPGHLVHDRADRRRGPRRGAGLDPPLEEPLQRAAAQLLDGRGGQPDRRPVGRLVGLGRLGVGRCGVHLAHAVRDAPHAPPGRRMGTGQRPAPEGPVPTGPGMRCQCGQPRDRRRSAPFDARIGRPIRAEHHRRGGRGAQDRDEPRGVHGRCGARGHRADRHPELLEEARGLQPAVERLGDRRHHQGVARPRAGDVHEPALLDEEVAGSAGRRPALAGELVDVQQVRAQPQVRPGALLDPGHHDQVPLEALRAMGAQEPHGFGAHLPGRPRLLRHLQRADVVDEAGQARPAAPLGRQPVGQVEQRHEGVEVTVSRLPRRPAGERRAAQSLRPVGGAPGAPQHLGHQRVLGQRGPGGVDHAGDAREPGPRTRGHFGTRWQPSGRERLGEQPARARRDSPVGRPEDPLPVSGGVARSVAPSRAGGRVPSSASVRAVTRARPRPARPMLEQRRPGQRPDGDGVHAAQRPGEQLGTDLRGRLARRQREAEHGQEHGDGRLLGQGQLVGRDRDRDAGRPQRPHQHRATHERAAHEHDHLRPRQRRPVQPRVGAQQHVRDPRGLGGPARVRARLHPCLPHGGHRAAVLTHPLGGQARQGVRAEHAVRRLGDGRAEPPRVPQDDRRRRGPRHGVGEGRREAQDAAHVGTPEAVDGLVRVAHGDHLRAAGGQRADQLDLRRVGVLVLVDDDQPERLAQRPPSALVGRQADRPLDQGGVVDRPLPVQDVGELLGEAPDRAPRRQPRAAAERAQVRPAEVQPARPREQAADLLGDPAGAHRGPERGGPRQPALLDGVGEQLAQPGVLLAGREQPRRLLELHGVRVLPHERVGERVEGGHHGHRAAAQPHADALGELVRGPPAERQGQHGLRRQLVGPGLQPAHDQLGQGGRLARPRTGEHEQVALPVLDDGQLLGVEHGRGGRVGRPTVQADGGRGRPSAGRAPPPPHRPGTAARWSLHVVHCGSSRCAT